MMMKTEHYYYTDSGFQLELNLQGIRRDLIAMLDDFEQTDCVICKRLKCRCSDTKPLVIQLSDSGRTSQESNKTPASITIEEIMKKAPPAESLPKPKWETQVKNETCTEPSIEEWEMNNDVETWVRAVTPSAPPNIPEFKRFDFWETNADPAFPWSTLSACTDGKKTSLEIIGSKNVVEAFFRNFKNYSSQSPQSPAQTTVSFMSSNLADAFKVTPKKPCEYTYF